MANTIWPNKANSLDGFCPITNIITKIKARKKKNTAPKQIPQAPSPEPLKSQSQLNPPLKSQSQHFYPLQDKKILA